MRIIIDIPTDQEQSFTEDFLSKEPIPLDEGGNPLFTFEAWVKKFAVDRINGVRKLGALRRYEADFVPPADVAREDIIELPR